MSATAKNRLTGRVDGDFVVFLIESVYVNMTPFGLGKVGQLVQAQGPRETAAGRLTAST
jgi:hypothetical protein